MEGTEKATKRVVLLDGNKLRLPDVQCGMPQKIRIVLLLDCLTVLLANGALGAQMSVLVDDLAPCILLNAGKGHSFKKNKKKQNSKKHAEFNDMRWWIFEDERTGTCTATWYKEPPCIVITKRRNGDGM